MLTTGTLGDQEGQFVKRPRDNSPVNDEHRLIVQARQGLVDAIEDLVERYEARIFRLVSNITRNREDAEEVVQNAFLKAFRNLDKFREDSRFYTWLVRIAVDEALMKIRGRRLMEVSIDDIKDSDNHVGPHELEDWGPNPEERYSQEELHRILETTIRKLDHGYRIVFHLRDIEGFSTEETARALNISVPAVKTRLQRARLRLRNSLDVYFRKPRAAMTKRSVYAA